MTVPGFSAALLLVLLAPVACGTAPPVTSAPATSTSAAVAPAAASPVASSTSLPAPAGPLPNRALTPGETFAGVTAQQVCVSGYARSVRNVLPAQYGEVYGSYGIPYPEPSGTYELDHLVPLELGGDNANRNLWPEAAQPVPGFHEKDQLENYLHDAVCSGRMALADAQSGIASDWIALYRQYLRP